MIINRSNLAIATTGFKAAFMQGFEGAPIDFDKFVMEVPSTTSTESYGWLGSTTRFREWVGERIIQALAQHDYSIKNKTFENTVGVPREAFEDDQYGIYGKVMQQLGQDAKEHPAELVYALLKAGFATKCFDGQYFFDTDHPVLDATGAETSVSNSGGGSGTPWFLLDTSRAMRPIILQKRRPYNFIMKDKANDDNVIMDNEFIFGVDARLNVGYGLWQLAYGSKQTLDATNFNAAYAAMQGMKGDSGKPLGIRPTVLLVPPSLRAAALTVVKAERDAAGATNINKDVVEVISTPWLA